MSIMCANAIAQRLFSNWPSEIIQCILKNKTNQRMLINNNP